MKKTLILQAHAKINVALWVKEKRPDGFHEIASVMQTITLADTITLQEIKEPGIFIDCDHPQVPLGPENLVHRAARLFLERFEIQPSLSIRIEKRIPVAAGLAGGSTDAATVFLGLAKLYDKGLPLTELMQMSQAIGSDVPFLVHGGCALAAGRGEILNFHDSPRPPLVVLVAVPKGLAVSTKWAYENYQPGDNARKSERFQEILRAFQHHDLEALRHQSFNDLESVTLQRHPEVAQIKQTLQQAGDGPVLMSGSGPSVFGLYRDRKAAAHAAQHLDQRKVDLFLEHTTRSGAH